jgi:hypothetical protein
VLITGSTKEGRRAKAWELLVAHGFRVDAQVPDLVIICQDSDKKSIGIAQTKTLSKFLQERPFEKKVKAVLLDDAELLTGDAQGSLLKLLEEPPAFALICILCAKEGSLLPTVVSRCQKLVLPDIEPSGEVAATYNLADKSYAELFELAATVAQQSKDEVASFLEGLLRYDVTHHVAVVPLVERAIKDIRGTTVALKFALEYVFLSHKH